MARSVQESFKKNAAFRTAPWSHAILARVGRKSLNFCAE